MLVDVGEDARELAVDRHLVQRPGRAHDGVQHRQRERDHQHDRDQPVQPVPARAEDAACERREDRPGVGVGRVGQLGAEHDHEADRDHGVDEEAVQALQVHGDLGVPLGVAALADVAGRRLHGDHVPGQKEGEGDVDGQPVVAEGVGEEARAVHVVEARQVAEVARGRLEQRQDRQQRERDHGQQPEHGGEHRAQPDAQPGGDEHEQDADHRDDHGPVGDRGVDGREALLRQVELLGDVEGGQDHVQRRDREPAQPVRPGRETVHVLGEARPLVLVRHVGVGRRAARALGHHGRQLGQEQAQQVARDRDQHHDGDGRCTERVDHHRRDPGDQDRPRQADHERAPPIGFARETPTLIIGCARVDGGQIRPPVTGQQ